MLSTFRLLNSYFFRTLYGPVLAFIFPTIILAVLGNILNIQYVFPGIIAMCSVFISVQAMPLGMLEMKNSTLFKYIGLSPVDPKKFILAVVLYYVMINVIAVIILMIMTFAIFNSEVADEHLFSGIGTAFGLFSFIFANIFHTALGLVIGITIAVFASNPQQALTLGFVIVIPSMFLSGMVIPVDIIAESDGMQWVSRFTPFRYTTGNIIVAATPETQMGDFLDLLSMEEKSLIFAPATGHASGLAYEQKGLADTEDLMHAYDVAKGAGVNPSTGKEYLDDFYDAYVYDKVMFDMLFVEKDVAHMTGSDNNMFNMATEFGVRKVPDVDKIKLFTQDYLGRTIGGPDSGSIAEIAAMIEQGQFEWMDIFLNQSTVLFEVGDRVVNVLAPVALISGMSYASIKRFKWSSR